MATVIIRTDAGRNHDHAVRMGEIPASPITAIVIDGGPVVVDVLAIKGLTAVSQAVHRIENDQWAITERNGGFTRFEGLIPETINGAATDLQINGIGLVLENGLLWGYAPYLPNRPGLHMDGSFSWTVDLIVTELESGSVNMEYTHLDVAEIRARLLEMMKEDWAEMLCNGLRVPDRTIGELTNCEQAAENAANTNNDSNNEGA